MDLSISALPQDVNHSRHIPDGVGVCKFTRNHRHFRTTIYILSSISNSANTGMTENKHLSFSDFVLIIHVSSMNSI